MITIRGAEQGDLPDILAILNHEISEGAAHFGTEPMEIEDIYLEFSQSEKFPWTVAALDGSILGFARASAWKARGAYSRTCEVGVYVRPESQGQGIAKSIYEPFLADLKARGFKTILGGIALPNPASIKLHEAFGFRHVGTLPSVGWKFEEWRDVGYWALVFDDV